MKVSAVVFPKTLLKLSYLEKYQFTVQCYKCVKSKLYCTLKITLKSIYGQQLQLMRFWYKFVLIKPYTSVQSWYLLFTEWTQTRTQKLLRNIRSHAQWFAISIEKNLWNKKGMPKFWREKMARCEAIKAFGWGSVELRNSTKLSTFLDVELRR